MEPHVYSASYKTLRRTWLLLARVGWVGIVVPVYVLLIAHVPAFFAALHILHAPNVQTFTGQLTVGDVRTLERLGLSLDFYAVCMVVGCLLFQFSYAVVGVLLIWRKSGDRVALVTSFALMMLPFGFANITLQALPAGWAWLIPTLSAIGNGSLLLCGFLFPDGQFAPRWTRWLVVGMVGYWVVVIVLPSWGLDRSMISLLLFFSFVVEVMGIQVYRYRYVSTLRQRQQTKWALFGVVIAVVGNIGPRLLYDFVLLPSMGRTSSLAFALEVGLIMCLMLAIPITLGIAILRYRLWDIDVLINRTLVYSTLTAILTGVYVGLILGLQALMNGISRDNSVAIVVSTLVIVVLFEPLRKRIQKVIDRRFYRRKYDAAKILAAFSMSLRGEVELTQLSERLVDVVKETMEPTHVFLWLPKPSEAGKYVAKGYDSGDGGALGEE